MFPTAMLLLDRKAERFSLYSLVGFTRKTSPVHSTCLCRSESARSSLSLLTFCRLPLDWSSEVSDLIKPSLSASPPFSFWLPELALCSMRLNP